MSGQQQILLILTFLFGLFTGAYLYLTVYAPNYGDGLFSSLRPAPRASDITIIASMYGGCFRGGMTCPEFRLERNGRLMIIPAGQIDEPERRIEILLSSSDMRDLRRAVGETDLAGWSQPVESDFCDSYVDGVDYRYIITRGEETYTVDTCSTAYGYGSDLHFELMSLWEYESRQVITSQLTQ